MARQAAQKAVVKKTPVKKAVVKKVAARATKASAKLENREVPAGYVRPAAVQRLLAERRTHKRWCRWRRATAKLRFRKTNDLVTANGPLRVFTLLHDARPVLLNLGEPGGFDIAPWANRVQLIDAKYVGEWDLPVLGAVTAPTAVLIRPDGYVAWVGELTDVGLRDALTTWFGPPTAA
jgi:hypothetical protein